MWYPISASSCEPSWLLTIYRIVFFHHLSRERISSQQDFGIKWQHKDLKSNGSTAGRTFLSAAGGFAGQSQPGHLTGTHRRRKSVRFAAAAPAIRYHFRINYLPSLSGALQGKVFCILHFVFCILYFVFGLRQSPRHCTSENSSLSIVWGKIAIVWGRIACNKFN